MIVLLILQLAAAQGLPVSSNPVLWRDFQSGMSPEQAAEKMRSLDGVVEANVNRSRKGKFKSIDIKYKDRGVSIGQEQMTLVPVFVGDVLTELELSSSACASVAAERMKILRQSLIEKYGRFAPERVIDENGVEVEKRGAFWNDQTRVRMSFQINAPSLDYTPSYGGKTSRALAGLANLMNRQAYEAAVAACPSDQGATVTYTLNYSSQRQFLVDHDAEVKAREAKTKATRDAL